MKLAIRAALAALAMTSWAAQAATFEVPLEGFYVVASYTGIDSSGHCFPDLRDPSFCERHDLAGTFLTVTTPSFADGSYSDISLLYGAPLGEFNQGLQTLHFSFDDSPYPQFVVDILHGQVVSIFGTFGSDEFEYDMSFDGRKFYYHASAGGHVGAVIEATLVPEPAGGALLLAGLAVLVAVPRHTRRDS